MKKKSQTSDDLNHNNGTLYMHVCQNNKTTHVVGSIIIDFDAYKLQIKFVIRKPITVNTYLSQSNMHEWHDEY